MRDFFVVYEAAEQKISCAKPAEKHTSHPRLNPVVSHRLAGISIVKIAKKTRYWRSKAKQRRLPLRNLLT